MFRQPGCAPSDDFSSEILATRGRARTVSFRCFRERTGSGDARARELRSRGVRTAAAKTPKCALATTTGRALRAAVGRARNCTCWIERGERKTVSLDGNWTVISGTGRGRGARRAPRASVGSGPIAAHWTRIEPIEPRRVGLGSGARARARDAALERARRPQPADAVRPRFRAPKSDAGVRERDAATGATALLSPWGP